MNGTTISFCIFGIKYRQKTLENFSLRDNNTLCGDSMLVSIHIIHTKL